MERLPENLGDSPDEASDRALARQKQLGDRVKQLRKSRGYTQAELVERLRPYDVEMHSTTLAKLESGGRPTTVHEVWALASVLGCEYTRLLPAPLGPGEDGALAAAKEAVELAQARVDDLDQEYSAAGQALAHAVLELRAAEAARDEQARQYLIALGRSSAERS
ncbi:helix-turn-helix domain-containing protein [Ornithinimicrobium sp. LYQ121]|uniref:helix-turn-helix domain-containing protein n=1 Tax=Ornithinimicrobium sp. LYQ121 TaxID=3378801 RepID=UPI00385264BC